ncbi:MAG: NADH:ubiquinone oxidoreductase [Desulfuromonas sp.]|nr:MAG: NADH:ubiquinone oxidoreductase [Desulfuromonas sp.]
MNKRRIGFFDFTGCEGCQLTVLNLEEQLLELLELVDVVEFREVMSGTSDNLDIAFVEGSVRGEEEIERLQRIRQHARILVALGACADTAGINGLTRYCDGEKEAPQPLQAHVKVDYRIPGCPIDGREFLEMLQGLLLDRHPELPVYSLCVECKLAELPCTFEDERLCLGPVVRAGCGAVCIAAGDRCRGCRGLVDNPRATPYNRVLEEHGVSAEQILAEFRVFNIPREESS